MSSNLKYKPLDNIGINGLNTQSNPTTLDASWLTRAENIVLKASGRISFRKGLKQQLVAASSKIGAIGEHAGDVFASVDHKIYHADFTDTAALSATTPSFTHTDTTVGSDWQFVNFNRNLYAFQSGSQPLEYSYDSSTSTWGWALTTNKPTGFTSSDLFQPSCGMGYYGRNWVGGLSGNKDVVYYSDTLIGDRWASSSCSNSTYTTEGECVAAGATWTASAAGYIDLKTVWGSDEIVAIAPFYGQLVIFGKQNIVIYQQPHDPTAMTLTEVIRGVGCVSRDSVKAMGDDLMFLSDTGVRSLSRTTELDKVPLTDYSVNIKDDVIRNITRSRNAKACYVENEGVYILSFVDINITYIFDMKHFTPNKAPRLTTWHFLDEREPSAMMFTASKGFLVGQKKGSIATYEGYSDKDLSGTSTYSINNYTGAFKTIWINLGDSAIASLLKKLKAVIDGGAGLSVGIKWYKDFNTVPSSPLNFELNPITTGNVAKWGASTSLYGNKDTSLNAHTHIATDHLVNSTYTPIYGLKEYNIPLSGSAKHLQFEMTAVSSGFAASLQDMTLLYKQGKIR